MEHCRGSKEPNRESSSCREIWMGLIINYHWENSPPIIMRESAKKKWGAFIDFCLLLCHPRKVKTLEGPMVLGEPCWPPWISWNHLEAVTKGKVVCDLGLCVLRALCCLPSFYFLTQHNGLMVLPSVSGHCFILPLRFHTRKQNLHDDDDEWQCYHWGYHLLFIMSFVQLLFPTCSWKFELNWVPWTHILWHISSCIS